MYYIPTSGSNEPTAHIAVNHNRLKHYGDKVYLKNGTHFEIELFNPKQNKVLAVIHLNGVPISGSGIVIRPGERIFLERWIDDAKKFCFETYTIEDSKESVQAIEKNGKVKIQFYDENMWPPLQLSSDVFTCTWTHTPLQYQPTAWNPIVMNTNTTVVGCTADYTSIHTTNTASSNVSSSFIETGRAEKGESSEQKLTQDSSCYNFYCFKTIELQILPEGMQPIESTRIRNYCSNCGTRIKNSNWKFCPTCGNKQ